ncbi:bis(5'-nucleosyl)-tetraphosphatase (symmetrical) YqeK [Lusitaniella coriacea LEGE 07157]|uniref:bis(5'-nucleosyl)-tetraphosphatase (symmetrical) n=1 Tax=Lusitaniella coriacea LEGE 07157 TaxID=945747 RepID=A0A8J7IUG9_9CYAN|nr:bis(5'-nucleosyl)-tetraphosphatase (symmetrical) YqeK [Lusitaniella coriacea]MBE9117572.1 bis(5'-nucleosyl)-tetraphosphatase (symmetrical) YqeK [Lusitaniella coriacea LEGE 07157]
MRDRVLDWLKDNVPPPRLQHILGVEQMSGDLARHYHLDEEKARWAGLMHDLAKCFKPERLLQMAREEGVEIDPVCENTPHLLHADVSAIVAQHQFGMNDPAILEAIRNHTLGRPQMSDLSCVVFMADALEPSRGESAELEALRRTSWENLYQSVAQTSDYSLRHLLNTRRVIHPRTILTRNWAMQKSRDGVIISVNST